MDRLKLRICAKKNCESCKEQKYCNDKYFIKQEIMKNFIHIDLQEWRKNRQEGGKYKYK